MVLVGVSTGSIIIEFMRLLRGFQGSFNRGLSKGQPKIMLQNPLTIKSPELTP